MGLDTRYVSPADRRPIAIDTASAPISLRPILEVRPKSGVEAKIFSRRQRKEPNAKSYPLIRRAFGDAAIVDGWRFAADVHFSAGPLGRYVKSPASTGYALHGWCVGGGMVLAAACDLRVASADARFSIPEVDLGLPLAWGGVPRLVREIGPARVKELIMTCRAFDAAEAAAIGFVNRVVPAADLVEEVDALARSLAAKAAHALLSTKRHVNAVTD